MPDATSGLITALTSPHVGWHHPAVTQTGSLARWQWWWPSS